MKSTPRFNFALWLLVIFPTTNVLADGVRPTANRIRHFDNADPSTYQSSLLTSMFPDYGKFFKAISEDPLAALQQITSIQATADANLDKAKNEFDAFVESIESIVALDVMSMPYSDVPSDFPSLSPTSVVRIRASSSPSSAPTLTPTKASSSTNFPSNSPSVSAMPTSAPSASPSLRTSISPSTAPSGPVTANPTLGPTVVPTSISPTVPPTDDPTLSPSSSPSSFPSAVPTRSPTNLPTLNPTGAPNVVPSAAPSFFPTAPVTTSTPTVPGCGISQEVRSIEILALLDIVADSALIRDPSVPQGMAAVWLIEEDTLRVCPDNPKILQRFAMAVVYFSTGGDSWFQCSANPAAIDPCGVEEPFVGAERFLAPTSECAWAGISCLSGCVTEIEFEENNLVGTIPTEIGFLTDLAIWGMERGSLTSTIPTEIGLLTNLIFLDLDFNDLSGSLSAELLSLSSLTQLDVNDNRLSGSISGVGVFPAMEFLQLHNNLFTGTIPTEVGNFTNLAAFTLHETSISGAMPEEVCNLLATRNNGGILGSLIADCNLPMPDIVCNCCTDCRDP